MSVGVRPAAVAGSFYPGTRRALRRAVADSFAGAVPPSAGATAPKAIVVPHAGYRYSGAIAASAFRRLVPVRDVVTRIVLLGPSHRMWVDGMAVAAADAFETPLGLVSVDRAARDAVATLAGVDVDDRPHALEHSLEVQLPFLQTVLPTFSVLPLAVGGASTELVADVIDRVWGGPETVVVVSTDLSHYHPYDTASGLDATTAAAIVALRHERIADIDACGAHPLRGLLALADRRGLTVEQLDLRNSGDTSGDRDRVVGYGAFAVA